MLKPINFSPLKTQSVNKFLRKQSQGEPQAKELNETMKNFSHRYPAYKQELEKYC